MWEESQEPRRTSRTVSVGLDPRAAGSRGQDASLEK